MMLQVLYVEFAASCGAISCVDGCVGDDQVMGISYVLWVLMTFKLVVG